MESDAAGLQERLRSSESAFVSSATPHLSSTVSMSSESSLPSTPGREVRPLPRQRSLLCSVRKVDASNMQIIKAEIIKLIPAEPIPDGLESLSDLSLDSDSAASSAAGSPPITPGGKKRRADTSPSKQSVTEPDGPPPQKRIMLRFKVPRAAIAAPTDRGSSSVNGPAKDTGSKRPGVNGTGRATPRCVAARPNPPMSVPMPARHSTLTYPLSATRSTLSAYGTEDDSEDEEVEEMRGDWDMEDA